MKYWYVFVCSSSWPNLSCQSLLPRVTVHTYACPFCDFLCDTATLSHLAFRAEYAVRTSGPFRRKQYTLTDLLSLCEGFLQGVLDEENASHLYHYADSLAMPIFEHRCLTFILRNWRGIVRWERVKLLCNKCNGLSCTARDIDSV